ncbi:DUF5682 family protein [Bilophila wadsworthia]|uniref:DUF5682 family protein n=1 Tax=Bilophila wadsworthia TaxID=35833 RepID=UPI003AB20299
MPDQTVRLFGIRHHGPGCARSLLRALEAMQPDCLLIEGPPDGESVLPFVLESGMCPPVALLVYAPDDSRRAVFYPFAEFSPEWRALRYGLGQSLPVRFMDLPIAHQFGLDKAFEDECRAKEEALRDAEGRTKTDAAEGTEAPASGAQAPENTATLAPEQPEGGDTGDTDGNAGGEASAQEDVYGDPLDWLGRAAGYGDGEAWWNHMVEERIDGLELFDAIREAMTALRAEAPRRERGERETRREALREAYMRKTLRQAKKEGFQRIAVICGAWHVPALEAETPAKQDNELLKGLPKMKVAATWTPWTYANLSSRSGYGAGVTSPAWYEHLWRSGKGDRAIGWLTHAARLFREQDMDCSSAHIIEASRLATSLAALRERPRPGLPELYEALQTTVCMGDSAPLRLIERQLIVGDKLGTIPETAPTVPLQRDLEQQQKSLRLKPEAARKVLDLDLRQANDLARSHLLHRLRLLEIGWATPGGSRNAKGTFHELWEMQWAPELSIAVIAASRWGNTIFEAATAKAVELSGEADLLRLAELVNDILFADLPDAVGHATRMLEEKAATANDVGQLLEAIPPLAAIARYGNVRQTDAGMVARVLEGLIPRASIGLPGACTSLDDESAAAMRDRIIAAHNAVRLLGDEDRWESWLSALHQTALRDGTAHELLRGMAVRLLFDEQRLPVEEAARLMSLSLSAAAAPASASAWIEGFLNQSALVLLHDDALWGVLANWLDGLNETHFTNILPMLRRTFSGFSAPERRQLGERAKRAAGKPMQKQAETRWDAERAALPVPLLRRVLGLTAQA